MSNGPPSLQFQLTPIGSNQGFPVQQNQAFTLLLDNAVSGGAGTTTYLQHLLQFSDFASYLNTAGASAFSVANGPQNTLQATASNGTANLTVNVQLQPPAAAGQAAQDGPPVFGMATVRLSLSGSMNLTKIVQFGVSLAELPAGVVVTQQLWQALFRPLLGQLSKFVQSSIQQWLSTEVGDDAAELGETLQGATEDVAADVGDEAAEVMVDEEVVAELAVDLSAAVPALGALALLVAVPVLLSALAKNFVLHLEVDNLTDVDFQWSLPYVDEGSVTVQPAQGTIPAMSTATDLWGDQTTVPVVYAADFSAVNDSGYSGIGFALALTPQGYTGQDIAAVVSIPWIADNGVWLGDPGSAPDWGALYSANSGGTGGTTAAYGNQRFYASLAIDALSGNNDEYHCVLRIERL